MKTFISLRRRRLHRAFELEGWRRMRGGTEGTKARGGRFFLEFSISVPERKGDFACWALEFGEFICTRCCNVSKSVVWISMLEAIDTSSGFMTFCLSRSCARNAQFVWASFSYPEDQTNIALEIALELVRKFVGQQEWVKYFYAYRASSRFRIFQDIRYQDSISEFFQTNFIFHNVPPEIAIV